MKDFEKRVWDIMISDDADLVKLEKIRRLYTPQTDPATCKNDRLYRIIVNERCVDPYETIGWRGSENPCQWSARQNDYTMAWVHDNEVTVLGEYRPGDEYVGKVYECIEDAIADGMGRYSVLEDGNGSRWMFDNGVGISNHFAPFTVLHWVPKKVGE